MLRFFWLRKTKRTVFQLKLPLVRDAIKDAGENGEQPQAIALLVDLSGWVRDCLISGKSASLERLQSEDPTSYEAVQSIATGKPRKGHSVVGVGTYRDGQNGWKAVAQEFVDEGFADEVNLYRQFGAKLVNFVEGWQVRV